MAVTALPSLDTWIGGRAEPSEVEETAYLHDPNTGEELRPQRSSSAGQVERALDLADRTHRSGDWARLSVEGRATYLLSFAEALDRRSDAIAELDAISSGVPLRYTRLFAGSLGDTVRGAITLALEAGDDRPLAAEQGPVRLRRVPWGPTALIVPWNAPAALAVKKAAFSLVAGATVILKPSPVSPTSAQLVAEAVAEAALPAGVFGLVLGGGLVGEQICADSRIRAIAMTGSTATGRRIAATAAPRFARLRLELGSNNPVVVRRDADVEHTASSLLDGMTKLNGQWCEAPRNVFAHQDVYEPLVEALRERVLGQELGSSLDESTTHGPMAFRDHRDGLVAQRDRWLSDGHEIAHGEEPTPGWFFAPTLVTGDGITVEDEVFGPMLTVEPVDSDERALARAEATAGGLAAYVFTEDVEAGLGIGARLTAGEVKVNGTSLLDMSPESAQSFFASSGLGGHGDRDVLEFYTGQQVVGLDLVDAPL